MTKIHIVAAATAFAGLIACLPAVAVDVAAGQKTFEAACAACHELKDFSGKTEAALETDLKGIVAGTVKHKKKLTSTPADIANIATYISTNEPK